MHVNFRVSNIDNASLLTHLQWLASASLLLLLMRQLSGLLDLSRPPQSIQKYIGRFKNWPVSQWVHFVSEGRSSGCWMLDFLCHCNTQHFCKCVSKAYGKKFQVFIKATYLYTAWIFIQMLKMETNSHMDQQIVIYKHNIQGLEWSHI